MFTKAIHNLYPKLMSDSSWVKNQKLFGWNRTQCFVYSQNLYAFDDAFEKFENSLSFSINSSQQICCGHSDKLLENMHTVVKFSLHKYAE